MAASLQLHLSGGSTNVDPNAALRGMVLRHS